MISDAQVTASMPEIILTPCSRSLLLIWTVHERETKSLLQTELSVYSSVTHAFAFTFIRKHTHTHTEDGIFNSALASVNSRCDIWIIKEILKHDGGALVHSFFLSPSFLHSVHQAEESTRHFHAVCFGSKRQCVCVSVFAANVCVCENRPMQRT